MRYSMRTAALVLIAVFIALTTATAGIQRRPLQQPDVAPAGSRVEYKTFQSKLLAQQLRYGIYLPPSYAGSTKQYPVLYFLHGLNENETRWSSRGRGDAILDKLIAEGKIGEFIVAIPFAATSFYTNTRKGDEPWEDAIVTEFIPMIESTYRVAPGRTNRGISGISMGGYGSLKIAFKHPEMFGSVSAHSAALIPDLYNTRVSDRRLDMFKSLFDHIYGINQDLTYWDANNPLTLAKDMKRFDGLKIYFDCGTEDDYGFFVGTKVLDDILTKGGYPHEMHLYPGNHGWDFALQHLSESLLFHSKAFSGK